ncbi:MAG: DUF1934 domain-containing protein, partial [Clostridia bacterium]|nr:DUF1934 domain-containing protein [Clostridia bacterium]
GSFFISYEEGELSGLGDVKTMLYIRPDHSVVLQRTGDFQSRMAIEPGKRSSSLYRTPHGDMMISVYGESVEHDLTPEGGSLSLCYTIDSNLELISRNTVKISVRRVS